jgi:hypothetical protein
MSFIQKSDAVVINTKLTNNGRLLLASGALTFSRIEFGDSEIDYEFLRDFDSVIDGSDLSIMRPKDANPIIKHPIPITNASLTTTKADITLTNSFPISVVNTAKQRGFFTGSTSAGFTAFTSSTYVLGITTALIASVSGTNQLTVASAANITAGTMLLVDWRNPKLTSFSNLTGVIGEIYPRPFLWYKVSSVTGNIVTVDRLLPNFSNTGGSQRSLIYVYPPNNAIDNYYSTGTTVAYWNYNTLSFDSTCNIGANDDVPVWNLNIVYKDTPAGVPSNYDAQYYDGAIFSGFKEYIQGLSNSNTGKSQFAIIHYTNKSISNYYGEAFNNDTFKITLPTIMYHGKTNATMGVVLSAQTKLTQLFPSSLPNFTTEYYNLVETTSQNIVGKVFNDLRIAVIEDEELVNVLALKSDRSHTLPKPRWERAATSSSNALLKTNTGEYVALTYLFSSSSYNTNQSYGFRGGIHCGYIETLGSDGISNYDIRFTFPQASDLKFMKSQVTGSDGIGFNVNNFYVLAQKVPNGVEPSPTGWKLCDFTSTLGSYGSSTIPVSALTDFNYTLDNDKYTAGTSYDITAFIGSLPTPSDYLSTNKLGFGEESILLGNINTDIKATVYKTNITHTLGFNDYNSSNNPTWDGTLDDNIYVTEAAIYDQSNVLVAVGKLNNPIKKSTNKLFTVTLDMDF